MKAADGLISVKVGVSLPVANYSSKLNPLPSHVSTLTPPPLIPASCRNKLYPKPSQEVLNLDTAANTAQVTIPQILNQKLTLSI